MKPGIDYLTLQDTELKKVHKELLSLLIEVDRICGKYDIPYYLSYGTLIGAVRHKGFIPWDDDLDIQMLRKDYDRFCEVCKQELDGKKFFLQTQKTDKHYNWVYGKLRLKNTSFIRAGQEHIKQHDGMFLDILPLDNMPVNKCKHKIALFICKLCRKVLWSQVGKKAESNNIMRMLYKVLSFIPRSFAIFIFEFFAKLDNDKETDFLVSNNTFCQIYKREWYTERIKIDFEGYTFWGPKKYDEILSTVYGDYMKLPPLEERNGHCYASYIRFSDGSELKL